jgi:hypothetical protein
MDSTLIAGIIGAAATIGAAVITVYSRSHRASGEIEKTTGARTTPSKDAPGSGTANRNSQQFTVRGEVISTIASDLGIRVENESELREFWRVQRVDTDLDWYGKGPPVVSLGRREDIAKCKPGDYVRLTFVVAERANGKRGIRTVNCEIE